MGKALAFDLVTLVALQLNEESSSRSGVAFAQREFPILRHGVLAVTGGGVFPGIMLFTGSAGQRDESHCQ